MMPLISSLVVVLALTLGLRYWRFRQFSIA